MNISNFTECDIEKLIEGEQNPDSLKEFEKLIYLEVDGDEQKFINIASIFASYHGDIGSEFTNRWARA